MPFVYSTQNLNMYIRKMWKWNCCMMMQEGSPRKLFVNGEMEPYNTVNFITAIRLYIEEQLHRDAMSARIVLDLHDEEGIIANIEWD